MLMDKSKKIVNYFDFYSNELWTRLLTVVLNTAIIGIVYSGVSPGRCAKFLSFFNFSIHSIEFLSVFAHYLPKFFIVSYNQQSGFQAETPFLLFDETQSPNYDV